MMFSEDRLFFGDRMGLETTILFRAFPAWYYVMFLTSSRSFPRVLLVLKSRYDVNEVELSLFILRMNSAYSLSSSERSASISS